MRRSSQIDSNAGIEIGKTRDASLSLGYTKGQISHNMSSEAGRFRETLPNISGNIAHHSTPLATRIVRCCHTCQAKSSNVAPFTRRHWRHVSQEFVALVYIVPYIGFMLSCALYVTALDNHSVCARILYILLLLFLIHIL